MASMRSTHQLAALLVAVVVSLVSATAGARFIDFPYRDGQLLGPGQSKGGRIWVPNTARRGKTYTLVVLLHGLNKRGAMHPLLNGRPLDVSDLATRLIRSGAVKQRFVLAAPTQTQGADHSDTLWRRFDLEHFVKAVRRKLPRGIRLADRPVVMGHSGAGCTPGSGLWWIARKKGRWVRAMATMDTCMDERFGKHLRRYLWPPESVPEARAKGQRAWLINFWQKGWRRDPVGFEDAMGFDLLQEKGARGLRMLKRNKRRWLSARIDFDKGGGHQRIVDSIFAEALRRLFPTRATLRRLERELDRAKRAKRRREKAERMRLRAERRRKRKARERERRRKAQERRKRARKAKRR